MNDGVCADPSTHPLQLGLLFEKRVWLEGISTIVARSRCRFLGLDLKRVVPLCEDLESVPLMNWKQLALKRSSFFVGVFCFVQDQTERVQA